jgi:hypothetical protein
LNVEVGSADAGHFVIHREARRAASAGWALPLMHASFELKPPDSKSDARVILAVDRLVLRLDAPWLERLAKNFAPPRPEFVLDLQVHAANRC